MEKDDKYTTVMSDGENGQCKILKPCPFCGSEAEITRFGVYCKNYGNIDGCCNAHVSYPSQSGGKDDKEIVLQIQERSVKRWNTRPSDAAKDKEIERLKNRLDRFERIWSITTAYYEHCKNNHQLQGLNERARELLKGE